MRQLDAEPARGAENGLALADVDLAAVEMKRTTGAPSSAASVARKFTFGSPSLLVEPPVAPARSCP